MGMFWLSLSATIVKRVQVSVDVRFCDMRSEIINNVVSIKINYKLKITNFVVSQWNRDVLLEYDNIYECETRERNSKIPENLHDVIHG